MSDRAPLSRRPIAPARILGRLMGAEPPADRDIAFYAAMLTILTGRAGRLRAVGILALLGIRLTINLLILGILIWFVGMAVDRGDPITIQTREVVTPEVHAGEQLLIRTKRVRNRDCEMLHTSWLVDASERRFDYKPNSIESRGPPTEGKPVRDANGPTIPRDAKPGPAEFQSVFAYDCNMLQRAFGWSIKITPEVTRFTILPPRPPG